LAVDLPAFEEARALIKTENGKVDEATVAEAVSKMRTTVPRLFREQEKPWNQLSDAQFTERESSFRESLRTSRPAAPNKFASLDASRLDSRELDALTKAVAGQVNAYDSGVLKVAAARQKAEDAALSV
jgi:hypothetical protein